MQLNKIEGNFAWKIKGLDYSRKKRKVKLLVLIKKVVLDFCI